MKTFKIFLVFLVTFFVLAGSTAQAQEPRRMSGKTRGTIIGAGAGAVGGAVLGGGKGALIGAGVGALGGRAIGKHNDRKRAAGIRR
ncbi:MAG: hypothetical protein NVS3B25_18710 [Hymenobacter sp.]